MAIKQKQKKVLLTKRPEMPKHIAFSNFVNKTLVVSAVIVIIGQFQVQNHDLRLIYSLCMVIASTVGRYGTELTYLYGQFDDKSEGDFFRHKVYLVVLLFGLGGLLF
jgi:hypothetical protein